MPAHPLIAYLSDRRERLYAFARRAGVPGTSLTRALAGERGLSLGVALRIEKITGGRVPASCWIAPARRRATG